MDLTLSKGKALMKKSCGVGCGSSACLQSIICNGLFSRSPNCIAIAFFGAYKFGADDAILIAVEEN